MFRWQQALKIASRSASQNISNAKYAPCKLSDAKLKIFINLSKLITGAIYASINIFNFLSLTIVN